MANARARVRPVWACVRVCVRLHDVVQKQRTRESALCETHDKTFARGGLVWVHKRMPRSLQDVLRAGAEHSRANAPRVLQTRLEREEEIREENRRIFIEETPSTDK